MAPDRIRHVSLSSVVLPLEVPVSDAKVLTGRQKPMTEIAFLFAEVSTEDGHQGIGFAYSKRAGGPAQYAHAKEVADNLIGEDPPTSERSTTGCCGPARPSAGQAWPPGAGGDRHRAVGPQGQAGRPAAGQAAGAHTANRCRRTTPREASCTPPSRRSRPGRA